MKESTKVNLSYIPLYAVAIFGGYWFVHLMTYGWGLKGF